MAEVALHAQIGGLMAGRGRRPPDELALWIDDHRAGLDVAVDGRQEDVAELGVRRRCGHRDQGRVDRRQRRVARRAGRSDRRRRARRAGHAGGAGRGGGDPVEVADCEGRPDRPARALDGLDSADRHLLALGEGPVRQVAGARARRVGLELPGVRAAARAAHRDVRERRRRCAEEADLRRGCGIGRPVERRDGDDRQRRRRRRCHSRRSRCERRERRHERREAC